MIDIPIALTVVFATLAATFFVLWRFAREQIEHVLLVKRAADDKCADALKQRDAKEAERAMMAEKYDPVFKSMIALRERHSDALNEMYEELSVHKQRARTLEIVIEKMLPDMPISEARKQKILEDIQPNPMLAEYGEMIGASDGTTPEA